MLRAGTRFQLLLYGERNQREPSHRSSVGNPGGRVAYKGLMDDIEKVREETERT